MFPTRVRPRVSTSAWLRPVLLLVAALLAALAGAQVTDLTNLEGSWMRTWPAGPYSKVATSVGQLQTMVPLFSLKGPGRTSMSLGLYHRENNVPSSHFAVMRGGAGLGWRPTCVEYVKAGGSSSGGTAYDTDACQCKAGNVTSHWYPPSFDAQGVPTSYVRRPGCRADLTPLYGGMPSQLVGFQVVEQADRTVWSYTVQDPVQPDVWYLTSVQDPQGNTVTYSYDALVRVTQIVDAAGRTATLTWEDGSAGQLLSVALSAGGATRTWNLEYFAPIDGVGERLKTVASPPPSVGEDRPTVRFDYTDNDSLSDIYDPRGDRWHYTYDWAQNHNQAYGGLGGSHYPADAYFWGLQVYQVFEPAPTPPASYDPENPTSAYDANSPTTFMYYIYNSDENGNEFYCTFTDRNGNAHLHEYGEMTAPSAQNNYTGIFLMGTDWLGPMIGFISEPYLNAPITGHKQSRYTFLGWDVTQANLTNIDAGDYYVGIHGYNIDVDDNYLLHEKTFTYAGNNTGLLLEEKVYTVPRGIQGPYLNPNDPYDDWTFAYQNDRLVRTVDPQGHRTTMGWDWNADEMIWKEVDPQNDPTDPTYSKPGGLAIHTNYAYSPQGELASTWTGSDNPTVYSNFDAAGNAQTVTDPAGNATNLAYDAWGRKTAQTPPSPQGTTSYAYDDLDRLVQTTLPDGHLLGTTYDPNGNAVGVTKEGGAQVSTVFDALNRPISVTEPVDNSTSLVTGYGYDLNGNRTSVTNPRGKTTYYDFDPRNRNYQVRYPDGTNRVVERDALDRRTAVQNGRGQVTTSAYDEYDRLLQIVYPVSPSVTYAYRPDGLRTSMADGTGTSTYAYDDAGRLVSETPAIAGRALTTTYVPGTNRRASLSDGNQTWSYAYDAGLRLQSIGQSVGAATPATYAYNPDGSVQAITKASGISSIFGYDVRGRVASVQDGNLLVAPPGVPDQPASLSGESALSALENGSIPTPEPDASLETTALSLLAPQQVIQAPVQLFNRLGYTYGPDGNVQTYTSTMWGGNSWSTTYAHDLADRLVSEVRTGGASGNYNVGYAYDGNGNRTAVSRNGTVYPYDPAGDNDQFTNGEGYAFSNYDADGNPGSIATPNGSMALVYDEMGRVTSISGLGGSSFLYDGDGRRVRRGGTSFLYDGDQVVVEVGTPGGDLYRVPGVGYVRGGTQYFETDSSLGSAVKVTDGSNSTVGQTEYDAYGIEVAAAGSERGDFRFVGAKGYVNDDATGMQLLGARYYLPALGRFLTPDPTGQSGGLNLYAYCEDSPLMRVDPKGTYEVWLGWHNVAGPDYHSFVLVRDNVRGSKTYGWTWGFSGGPENFGIESVTNAGLLTDYSGLYSSRHFDSQTRWKVSKVQLESNEAPVMPLIKYLQKTRSEFDGLGLQYVLLNGPNSNTFASSILDMIGLWEGGSQTRRSADWVINQLFRRNMYFPAWGWPRPQEDVNHR